MTILPDAVHEIAQFEAESAYWLGYQQCLIDTAARGYELDDEWKPVARKTADQWLAERLAEMERHAARLAQQMGRPPGYQYRGGPVDWHTGRPARQLQAVS